MASLGFDNSLHVFWHCFCTFCDTLLLVTYKRFLAVPIDLLWMKLLCDPSKSTKSQMCAVELKSTL